MNKIIFFCLLTISISAQNIGLFKAPYYTKSETRQLISDSSYVYKSGNNFYPKNASYNWGTSANRWNLAYFDTLFSNLIRFNYTLAHETPYRAITITSNDATKGNFQWQVNGDLFGTTNDYTSSIGYNLNGEVGTEPTYGWNIEQDWENVGQHYLESYFQYTHNGQIIRPFFFQVNRADAVGDCNIELQAPTIRFSSTVSDTSYALLNPYGFSLYGDSTQTTNTILSIGAKNNTAGQLNLASGATGNAYRFSIIPKVATGDIWDFTIGGSYIPISFTPSKIVLNSAPYSGALSVSINASNKDSDYSLFIKKVASQTTSLFRVVNESNTVYATINNTGYFTLGTHVANKIFNVGNGTDIYSFDVASDKLVFYNDAGTPASIFEIDSTGAFNKNIILRNGLTNTSITIWSKDGTTTTDRYSTSGWGSGADTLKYSIAETNTGGAVKGSFNATGFSSYNFDGLTNFTSPYVNLSDTTDQQLTGGTTADSIVYSCNDQIYGFTHTAGHAKVFATYSGKYLVTFSGIWQSSAPSKYFSVWADINGTNVPRSNTQFQLIGTNQNRVVTVTFIVNMTAGQYLKLWQWSDDANAFMDFTTSQVNPTRPISPSIILTINKISD